MGYQTIPYLFVFLPLVLICYQVCPARYRKYMLLLVSWGYFWLCSRKLVAVLLAETLIVYGIGRGMQGGSKKKKKLLLFLGLGVLFGALLYAKYTGFFLENINRLLAAGGRDLLSIPRILAPIGISYYTLEAAGYLLEVYWGRMAADTDFSRVALFLSFFPQTMEGPIALYSDTAEALGRGVPIRLENLKRGALRILWGLFKKMVVADRLYPAVHELYTNYQNYHGVMILVAAVTYTFQLYMEFSGVMEIILGSGEILGISLPENFRQPFFSRSAAEFWRRWHITLGTWLKTYIFYPVTTSGAVKRWNKFSRKKYGKYVSKVGTSAMALLPVWLFNGLWHGPRWNYIFYGIYYFVILLAEVILEPAGQRLVRLCRLTDKSRLVHALQLVRTWIIIFVGELFFRADSLGIGLEMFRSMFQGFRLSGLANGDLLKLGLDRAEWYAALAGILVVLAVDILHERGISIREAVSRQNILVRYGAYYLIFFLIIIFGAYGSGYQQVDLIYAGF